MLRNSIIKIHKTFQAKDSNAEGVDIMKFLLWEIDLKDLEDVSNEDEEAKFWLGQMKY